MMQDYVRTGTYQRAILQNHSDFKDKVGAVPLIFCPMGLPGVCLQVWPAGHRPIGADLPNEGLGPGVPRIQPGDLCLLARHLFYPHLMPWETRAGRAGLRLGTS